MILTDLIDLTAYRVHTPKWAFAPTSGAGAAANGGRANRIGLQAIYLALSSETAIREYRRDSTLMPPGTLVTYTVTVQRVVDFRKGFDAAHWPVSWSEFYCDWQRLWFDARIEPPSWALGDQAIAERAKGILFASTMHPGGINLVLYPDAFEAGDLLEPYDPSGFLPQDQSSWR